MLTSAQMAWLAGLKDDLPVYLQSLEDPNQLGRFRLCMQGTTQIGQQLSLGFSTFALKLYYMLGLWPELGLQRQGIWLTYLNSFQVNGNSLRVREGDNAFIDPPQINYLRAQVPWYQRLAYGILKPKHLNYWQKVIVAETKQAIATLAQVGEMPVRPYRGFPTTSTDVNAYLRKLNWSVPWGAGGQASTLAVFLKTQASIFLEQTETQKLLKTCIQFFDDIADAKTGGYFIGDVPHYHQLVNGAMKVLTALDWLDIPVHYPERLIDTCLAQPPRSDGCHLVDAVYVLYRCWQQTAYRRADIQTYCANILAMINLHHNSDGGFSYYIGKSQTHYYQVPVSYGSNESDLHGTILLTWALVMLLEIFEYRSLGWQVIKL